MICPHKGMICYYGSEKYTMEVSLTSMKERSDHESLGCGGCTLALLFWFVEIANDFSSKKEDEQKIPRCLRWNFNDISEEFLKLTLPSTDLMTSHPLELSEVETQIIGGYIRDVEAEGTRDEDKVDFDGPEDEDKRLDDVLVDIFVNTVDTTDAAAAAAAGAAAAGASPTTSSGRFAAHNEFSFKDDRSDARVFMHEGETSDKGVKRKRDSKDAFLDVINVEEYMMVKSLPEEKEKVLESHWNGKLILEFYKGAEMSKEAWVSKDFSTAVITAKIFQQVLFSEHIRSDLIDWYGNFLVRNHIQDNRVIVFTTYVGRCALQKNTSDSRTLNKHLIDVLKERLLENVRCLLFPMNINEVHWILLTLDMKRWDWRLYDSYKTIFSKEDDAYVNTIKDSLYKEIKLVADKQGLTPQNGPLDYVDCTQQNSQSNACAIHVIQFMKDLCLGPLEDPSPVPLEDPSRGPLDENNIRVHLLALVLIDNFILNLKFQRLDEFVAGALKLKMYQEEGATAGVDGARVLKLSEQVKTLQDRILKLEATLVSTTKLETNQEEGATAGVDGAGVLATLASTKKNGVDGATAGVDGAGVLETLRNIIVEKEIKDETPLIDYLKRSKKGKGKVTVNKDSGRDYSLRKDIPMNKAFTSQQKLSRSGYRRFLTKTMKGKGSEGAENPQGDLEAVEGGGRAKNPQGKAVKGGGRAKNPQGKAVKGGGRGRADKPQGELEAEKTTQ